MTDTTKAMRADYENAVTAKALADGVVNEQAFREYYFRRLGEDRYAVEAANVGWWAWKAALASQPTVPEWHTDIENAPHDREILAGIISNGKVSITYIAEWDESQNRFDMGCWRQPDVWSEIPFLVMPSADHGATK